MNLGEIDDLKREPQLVLIQWLQRSYLLPDPLHCAHCNQAMELTQRKDDHCPGNLEVSGACTRWPRIMKLRAKVDRSCKKKNDDHVDGFLW